MKRAEKQENVEQLREALADVRHAVVIDFKGITVPEVTELRSQLRSSGSAYRVVKNRLLGLAVAESPMHELKDSFTGSTAIAWSAEDPVALAKTLTAFAKTAPVLKFKAVLLDGKSVPVEKLASIASLPTEQQLRGQIASVLSSPMRRLVTALAGPSRKMATVMGQRAEKLS